MYVDGSDLRMISREFDWEEYSYGVGYCFFVF